MGDEYLSSDFSYKNYSLQQLDNWVSDAMNCEDLTPQDIYDTVIKCVDDNLEYHKKYLTKSIELLSLLKGQQPVNFGGNVTDASAHDFDDFWWGPEAYAFGGVQRHTVRGKNQSIMMTLSVLFPLSILKRK
jgi:hypothetical protein